MKKKSPDFSTGGAGSPDEPLSVQPGSVGDVALPGNADPKGGARSPNEPLSAQPVSVGDVALPDNADSNGGASSPNEPLPRRKKLPHEIPSWVHQGTRHFITINCKPRNSDILLQHGPSLLESAKYYEQIGKWHLWLMVIMPDHIHFIATFDLSSGLKNTVSAWKRYQKKTHGIEWQPDFFEHRLRNEAEFIEKSHYIRMNPVRAELVNDPSEWPHVLDRISIDSGSVGDVALPDNADPKGGASFPNEPLSAQSVSVGDVALPDNADPKGGASSPNEPLSVQPGSVGDVALPDNAKSKGGASSPNEPPPGQSNSVGR